MAWESAKPQWNSSVLGVCNFRAIGAKRSKVCKIPAILHFLVNALDYIARPISHEGVMGKVQRQVPHKVAILFSHDLSDHFVMVIDY